ncbi:MAG: ATP-binding protein [Pseudomonadota bacterium]
MTRNSLAFRLVASAAIWCALLLSAAGYALSSLFINTVERNFDARLSVLLEGVVAGTDLLEDGTLTLRPQLGEPRFDQPLSGWYWEIDDNRGPVQRSASLWDQALPVSLLTSSEGLVRDVVGPNEEPLRLLSRAIVLPGRDQPFIYTIAGDRSEIDAEAARFNSLLSLGLATLLLGVIAAVFIQVRFGLEPLRRIRRGLAAIRVGQAKRLAGDYPEEIRPLASELNALLDHNEAVVERARTHVGNLAHGLKTPIAVLTNEASRAHGSLADLTLRQTELMREQVDHHLSRARAMATASVIGSRSDVAPVLSDLHRTLAKIYAERNLMIDISCASDLTFRGARQDLEEMLGNLLDNACKWAKSRVAATAEVTAERLIVQVEDDGPGLPPERRSEVLQRGRRLDERVPGSGLGLSIVVDIAELYGGGLHLEERESVGLRARLDLPAATPLPQREPTVNERLRVDSTATR